MRAPACPCSARHDTLSSKLEGVMDYDREFVIGTVSVLILGLLSERALSRYEMVQEAELRSERMFQLKEGTVYPALHQMERAGLLKATWRDRAAGRGPQDYGLN